MPSRSVHKLDNDVFTAIAHPVRRSILEILIDGEQTASTLAQPFDISRSAVSQHLSLLVDTGLISRHRKGREQVYQIQPDNLNEVYQWVQQFEAFWNNRLDLLGDVLDDLAEGEPDET